MKTALLFATICLVGCSGPTDVKVDSVSPTNDSSQFTVTGFFDNPVLQVKTVTIEGCEYFACSVNGGIALCHKGNCHNPIHIYNLEKPTTNSLNSLLEKQ